MNSTVVVFGIASEISMCFGVAPIAAMSEMFDTADFLPICSGVWVDREK